MLHTGTKHQHAYYEHHFIIFNRHKRLCTRRQPLLSLQTLANYVQSLTCSLICVLAICQSAAVGSHRECFSMSCGPSLHLASTWSNRQKGTLRMPIHTMQWVLRITKLKAAMGLDFVLLAAFSQAQGATILDVTKDSCTPEFSCTTVAKFECQNGATHTS